jgi:ElaB/YqjD/DUF883 family membrane-anchored ribosome-binding protein
LEQIFRIAVASGGSLLTGGLCLLSIFRFDLLLTERKMPEQNQSPAVQSLRKEQKQQRSRPANELDKALEDTFPASDPASLTHTAVAGGTGLEEDRSGPQEQSSNKFAAFAVERRIRERPIASLLAAAAIGFVFGVTR